MAEAASFQFHLASRPKTTSYQTPDTRHFVDDEIHQLSAAVVVVVVVVVVTRLHRSRHILRTSAFSYPARTYPFRGRSYSLDSSLATPLSSTYTYAQSGSNDLLIIDSSRHSAARQPRSADTAAPAASLPDFFRMAPRVACACAPR